MLRLSVQVVRGEVLGHRHLPSVTIGQKLLLIIKQLFVSLRGELIVGALHDGIDGASLLAEAAVNALGHVDIVTGRSATAIGTRFGINSNGLEFNFKADLLINSVNKK